MSLTGKGWIGVDLDRTLAYMTHFEGAEIIGEPIPLMQKRVLRWFEEGRDVRIFTARVWTDGSDARNREAVVAREAIRVWCRKHLGRELPVTCTKDYYMVELWDDLAVGVDPNTGLRKDGKP